MLIISIHQPLSCVNYDGPAGSIADVLSRATGLPIKADIGYKTPGSLGTFAGVERGIPVITLELPEKVSPTEYREKYLPALLAALKSF